MFLESATLASTVPAKPSSISDESADESECSSWLVVEAELMVPENSWLVVETELMVPEVVTELAVPGVLGGVLFDSLLNQQFCELWKYFLHNSQNLALHLSVVCLLHVLHLPHIISSVLSSGFALFLFFPEFVSFDLTVLLLVMRVSEFANCGNVLMFIFFSDFASLRRRLFSSRL